MNTFNDSLFQSVADEKNIAALSLAAFIGIVMGAGLFFFSGEPKLSMVVGCLSFLLTYITSCVFASISFRHAFEKAITKKTREARVFLFIARHWTAYVLTMNAVLLLILGTVFAVFGIYTGAIVCTIAMFVLSAPGIVRKLRK